MPNILPPAERRSVVLVTAYAALSLLLLVVGERIPVGGLGSGAMSRGARQCASGGPSSVAVANDGDMQLGSRRGNGRARMEDSFFENRVMHEHDSFSAAD